MRTTFDLMASEASTATGATLTSSAAGGASIPGACIYTSADSGTSVVIFAQVYPDSNTAGSVSPEQIAAALNGAYGVANTKPVSGIGDKAIEYPHAASRRPASTTRANTTPIRIPPITR